MKKMGILLLLSALLFANEAEDIIRKVDHNMRGKNVNMKMNMTIKTKNHQRTMAMESWSEGKKKSFVKIISPSKDRGITFLNLNGQMWQYIPKIERVIKIPPSMMLQNWMGSDITNDDVVKQSSIVDDYHAKLLSKKRNIATIQLTPKPNAAVVWGKIISKVNTTNYTEIEDVFYDENGQKIRVFTYRNVKKFGKYNLPTVWKIKPLKKKYNVTTLVIEKAVFDGKISSQYFQKSALKRFSR
ncbi:MAG TPA: outer membrane lipoprotein-sorting protein [Epsilonproteobacteria bacterium]|nr:outer membrane lipoprotein-sorting protein [Campylobacterota bacterium]